MSSIHHKIFSRRSRHPNPYAAPNQLLGRPQSGDVSDVLPEIHLSRVIVCVAIIALIFMAILVLANQFVSPYGRNWGLRQQYYPLGHEGRRYKNLTSLALFLTPPSRTTNCMPPACCHPPNCHPTTPAGYWTPAPTQPPGYILTTCYACPVPGWPHPSYPPGFPGLPTLVPTPPCRGRACRDRTPSSLTTYVTVRFFSRDSGYPHPKGPYNRAGSGFKRLQIKSVIKAQKLDDSVDSPGGAVEHEPCSDFYNFVRHLAKKSDESLSSVRHLISSMDISEKQKTFVNRCVNGKNNDEDKNLEEFRKTFADFGLESLNATFASFFYWSAFSGIPVLFKMELSKGTVTLLWNSYFSGFMFYFIESKERNVMEQALEALLKLLPIKDKKSVNATLVTQSIAALIDDFTKLQHLNFTIVTSKDKSGKFIVDVLNSIFNSTFPIHRVIVEYTLFPALKRLSQMRGIELAVLVKWFTVFQYSTLIGNKTMQALRVDSKLSRETVCETTASADVDFFSTTANDANISSLSFLTEMPSTIKKAFFKNLNYSAKYKWSRKLDKHFNPKSLFEDVFLSKETSFVAAFLKWKSMKSKMMLTFGSDELSIEDIHMLQLAETTYPFWKNVSTSILYGIVGHDMASKIDTLQNRLLADDDHKIKSIVSNYSESLQCFSKALTKHGEIWYPVLEVIDSFRRDSSGLDIALKALRLTDILKALPSESLLSNYNSEQQYLIAVCLKYCLNAQSYSDHRYAKSRCNFLMENSDLFSLAFACKPESKMNSLNKCNA